MARAVPIPPELWQRLAALDGRCDVGLRRTGTDPVGPMLAGLRNYKRMWVVQLWDRGAGQDRTITVEAASLVQALAAAVREAETRGWAESS